MHVYTGSRDFDRETCILTNLNESTSTKCHAYAVG